MKTYTLQIAGLERKLPIIALSKSLSIASFDILGDTEIVQLTAPIVAKRLPAIDAIVTAEAKGIPFAYEVAKQLGLKRYIVARKSVKPYMVDPLIKTVVSITTQTEQTLCLDRIDVEHIKGKRVAIVDDVISTGESLRALCELAEAAGAIVVAKAAILAEGDAAQRDDIIFLEHLPLFESE
ncbi:phosphoribosyltransferase family protein [Sporosarcina siberiensis]|uniref:Phosphoribosyltransferase family protein n=1 Tax=Sporosarcina siberiensis TaxID=1365606 RepID=A0ABW4SC32_9BACL